MNWDLLSRTKPIFDQLAALPPAERAPAAARLCHGDPELQAAVLAMFDDTGAGAGLLDKPLPDLYLEAAAPQPGWQVGNYTLLDEIGRGGHGTVFLAERADEFFQQRVAVKLLRGWTRQGAAQRRFEREVQILAALHHPGIVRLLDGGVAPGGLTYLVMEHVEGLPLAEHCRVHQLSLRARIQLLCAVCEAVSYAHQQLIVHRDLKPGNILVDPAGQPKLLDFGVAKLLDPDESSGLTTQADPAGMTWCYASPEQLEGRATLSTASDQFSIGVMLYELVCGQRPWHDHETSPPRFCRALEEEAPPRPARLAPGLDRDLEAVILKSLAREPEARYASVDDLRQDLLQWLAGAPVAARPVPRWVPLWRLARRHWAASSLFLLTALLAAGLALTWVRAQSQSRDQLERALALERCQHATQLTLWSAGAGQAEAVEAFRRALESLTSLASRASLSKSDALLFSQFATELGSYSGHPSISARGELNLAQGFYQAGLHLIGNAHPELPADERLFRQSVAIRQAYGGLLVEAGDLQSASTQLNLALNDTRRVLALPGLTPNRLSQWRMHQADLLAAYSRIPLHQGRLDECIDLRRQAVAHASEVQRLNPSNLQHQITLAGLKAALAWAIRERGQAAEALAELEQARALIDDFLRPDRLEPYPTSMAARNLYEEGRILLDLGRNQEAARRLELAIAAFHRLKREAPFSPMTGRTLMRALARLAEAGRRLGWPEPRLRLLAASAIAEAQQTLAANPGNVKVPGEVEEVRQALLRARLDPSPLAIPKLSD